MTSLPPAEFSRPIPVARLTARPATYRIEATAEERAALAGRFDLLSLDRLTADVTLSRTPEGAVRLEAAFEADLTQECALSLEPVPAHLAERFTLVYRPDLDEAEADRLALEQPEEETVEPLAGDEIDIGEAVAQELAITMDPFPRAPGVESAVFEGGEAPSAKVAAPAPAEPPNPFAALAPLKKQS